MDRWRKSVRGRERRGGLRQEAEREAQSFGLPENWKNGRDLVGGYTIDSAKTKDRDDAIALNVLKGEGEFEGAYLVSVSIADVASFISGQRTPAIEAHARQMGETHYLANGNRPMIPHRISEDVLSIMPGSDGEHETPVLTASIVVYADGTIGDVRLERERMDATAMTYDQLAQMRRDQPEDWQDSFGSYEEIAKLLRSQRQAEDDLTDNEPGELIVQEFMVLANTAIAQFMLQNNIPGLFRNHHDKDAAYYSPRLAGHDALQIMDGYCHFTSPLRRFADFVNHSNLLAFLEGQQHPYDGQQLQYIADHLNDIQESKRLRRQMRVQQLGSAALAASGRRRRRRISS